MRTEVIRRRLQKLDEYLTILHGLQHYNVEAFVDDPEHYGSAERFLQLAIETLTDIGNHVIAGLDLGTVDSYRDIPGILAKHGHINDVEREKWIQMIGFRNILVHDYLDVDREIVYRALQHDLEDIAALRRAFARFL